MANAAQHPESIGERLRRQRVEVLGRGLREMARIIDTTAPHLTDIEKGRRNPSEELMVKIAESYNLPIAELRSGWSKPDAIVKEVASQDATTAAKVPEFLRTARSLSSDQWDKLIRQAEGMAGGKNRKK
jgi:transcriptional regulator with XRE-family HTH domain